MIINKRKETNKYLRRKVKPKTQGPPLNHEKFLIGDDEEEKINMTITGLSNLSIIH